jgi:putative flippase GtrA
VNSPALSEPRPAGTLRALIMRFEGLLREIGKFGVVGIICYGIDVAIFNVLRDAMGEPLLPKSISTVVAGTAAFLGNRFWTWRHRERSGVHREYPLFFIVNLAGLAITLGCLWVSHDWLGGHWPALTSRLADNISGNIIGIGLASLFRFWAYRRFVFRPEAVPES